MITATEYMKLKEEGCEIFQIDKKSETTVDDYFEMLGELVESYPIGFITKRENNE